MQGSFRSAEPGNAVVRLGWVGRMTVIVNIYFYIGVSRFQASSIYCFVVPGLQDPHMEAETITAVLRLP